MNGAREDVESAGRTPAVLLVHGFTGTPWEVGPVVRALAAEGFAYRAPMLPGHGTSPADLARSGWKDWSAAVDRAVGSLIEQHGSVVLIGMSLGGLLVLDAAARCAVPSAIRGIVTLACALQLAPPAQQFLRAAEALGARMPDLYLPKPQPGGDARDPAVQSENPAYRVNPVRAARHLIAGQRAARAALPQLRSPLLAIHGLRDRTAPIAAALELIERSGAPDTTLVVLPRSGHLVGVDYDRDEVGRQVCAFVRRVA